MRDVRSTGLITLPAQWSASVSLFTTAAVPATARRSAIATAASHRPGLDRGRSGTCTWSRVASLAQSPSVAARLVLTRSGVFRLDRPIGAPSDRGQLRVPAVGRRDPWAFQTPQTRSERRDFHAPRAAETINHSADCRHDAADCPSPGSISFIANICHK